MMVIYYTHRYGNNKGESHQLLETAIALYLQKHSFAAEEDTVRAEASRLAASMQREGEHGKPFIPGFAHFSISHSGSTWAVLINDCSPCGLDIQYVRKVKAADLAQRIYADADAAAVASASDDESAEKTFFRLWTRREALVKAAGNSVFDEDVPSVNETEACYAGKKYMIADADIPGEGLFSAFCTEAAAAVPEIIEL